MTNKSMALQDAQDAIVDYGLVGYTTRQCLDLIHEMAGQLVYLSAVIQFHDLKFNDGCAANCHAESAEKLWKEQYPVMKRKAVAVRS